MKKLTLLYALVSIASIITLEGCNVLSKSQVKNIGAFAKVTESFADYPGDLLRMRSKLMLEEQLVQAVALDQEQIERTVAMARKQYNTQQALADSLDISFTLLKQYALLLVELSSPEHVENLAASKEGATTNLNKVLDLAQGRVINGIPTGVGSAISEGLFFAGKQLTRSQQAAAIRKYVPQGEIIITAINKNLKDIFEGDMKTILQSDSDKFFRTYKTAILAHPEKVNYPSVAQYAAAYGAFENLEGYRLQCISASAKMAKAHTKLAAAVKEKLTLKEIIQETKDFASSVRDLYGLYKKIGQPAAAAK